MPVHPQSIGGRRVGAFKAVVRFLWDRVMQAIPLTTDARQRMRVTLGNQPVILRAWWQPLSEAWYLSLYTRGEEPIALGRQVTTARRLIEAPGLASATW